MTQNHTVGKKLRLSKLNPNDTSSYKGERGQTKAGNELQKELARLDKLQERLFAESKQALLVIVQAMDGSGKDSAIKTVFSSMDPQGVHVTYFKAPTAQELAHDYLWRIHNAMPPRGIVGVFNRSHYEDVLIVPVHGWITPKETKRRYTQINHFEETLVQNGTRILKFHLHISKEEQAKQLQERVDDPKKRWKFNPGDLEERKLWDKYMQAYEDAIEATNTKHAPWYVLPGNERWYRNLVMARTIADTLEDMNPQYPAGASGVDWKTLKIV